MTDMNKIDSLFFGPGQLSPESAIKAVNSALNGLDDGELYLEYTASESLMLDDRKLKNASYNTTYGFGFRGVLGEVSSYSHSTEISDKALAKAAQVVQSIRSTPATMKLDSDFRIGTNVNLYTDENPLNALSLSDKISLLQEIDDYLRASNSKVKQVTASLAGEWQAIEIIRAGGIRVGDIRPLVRLSISVVVEHEGRMERGGNGVGGRMNYARYITPDAWKKQADDALRMALVNLQAVPAPAGVMQVVVGAGWPGVLLHEAVGHGLEGDFNRKKTSFFSDKIGQQVAAKGVTVVDDGTMTDRRGSLSVDDEGTPTSRTVLIEDGVLLGYMQDRQNARLMGVTPTGNGRRESFAHQPMPRMTNTIMLSGGDNPAGIISGVNNGIYAVNFGGGQVDITSGKFVFSASEAYLIEKGQVTAPIKGATLIGNGPDVMGKITAIGNDMRLDDGVGTCGKAGQSVPVGVGQPTLLIDGITVGGTGGV